MKPDSGEVKIFGHQMNEACKNQIGVIHYNTIYVGATHCDRPSSFSRYSCSQTLFGNINCEKNLHHKQKNASPFHLKIEML